MAIIDVLRKCRNCTRSRGFGRLLCAFKYLVGTPLYACWLLVKRVVLRVGNALVDTFLVYVFFALLFVYFVSEEAHKRLGTPSISNALDHLDDPGKVIYAELSNRLRGATAAAWISSDTAVDHVNNTNSTANSTSATITTELST